jgi:predicted double-glycine peptidase
VVIIACILITGLLQGDWNPWLVNNLAPEIHYARARAPDTFLRIPQSATAPAPQQESTQPQQPIAQLEFPRSGEFDAQGVVRQLQDASSECSVEALATLLALWDIPRETIVHELVQRPHTTAFSFSEAAQAFDLSVSPMEITLEQIKLLDYPCIVPLCDTPSRYVVLAKIVQDQVTILDPLKGKTVLSAEQFNSLWSRMAFFIWKDVDNLPPRLKKGDAHRQVVILKEKLAAKNFRVQLPLSDIFDQQLESAVRRLQTAYGLEADGIVGSRTKLAFYRIVYGSQLPNLQS